MHKNMHANSTGDYYKNQMKKSFNRVVLKMVKRLDMYGDSRVSRHKDCISILRTPRIQWREMQRAYTHAGKNLSERFSSI